MGSYTHHGVLGSITVFSVCMFVQSIGLDQNMSLLLHNLCIACRPFVCSISIIIHVCIIYVTIVLGDLCNNIGLVGVSAKWSYVTASPSHHDQAIPILSPLLFMRVSHPYIPLFRIFDLLVSPPFLVSFRQVAAPI